MTLENFSEKKRIVKRKHAPFESSDDFSSSSSSSDSETYITTVDIPTKHHKKSIHAKPIIKRHVVKKKKHIVKRNQVEIDLPQSDDPQIDNEVRRDVTEAVNNVLNISQDEYLNMVKPDNPSLSDIEFQQDDFDQDADYYQDFFY